MHKVVLLLIFAGTICGAEWVGRTWQSNLNLNNSANWLAGRAPCAADRLVLQSTDSIVLEVPEGETRLRALVLPMYMNLVLSTSGALVFTGQTLTPGCEGLDMVFKPTRASRWTDADNWDGWTQATPDLERIPCISDSVRFPAGGFYKILMPQSVGIGNLEINGAILDANDWYTYVEGEGRRQFFSQDGSPADVQIGGHPCQPHQWCSCRNEYLRSEVCHKVCSVTLCKEPVKPAGFCCPICGVYFLIDTKSNWEQKDLLANRVQTFLGDRDEIAWHSSRVGNFIQIVLVEKGEYSGKIPEIGKNLKKFLIKSEQNWATKEYHASGHVWYPVSVGQIITHFLSLLVFAALIIASIIIFYSQNWSSIRFSVLEGRPFVFVRFENQSGEVVVESPLNPTTFPENNTFDNPMYGATAQDQRGVNVENPIYPDVADPASEDFKTDHHLTNQQSE